MQLDLKAIEQAPSASGAEGIDLRQHLGGLALCFHHVWTKKSDQATRELLMGWFAVGPEQVSRLAAGLVAFGHLEPRDGGWRIKGAGRYANLRAKLSQGGHAAKGNLRQNAERATRAPGTEEASPAGPVEPNSSAPARRSRRPSEQEHCWENMERARVEHCEQLGIPPGACPRPRYPNKRLLEAAQAVGLVDSIASGETLTRWDLLTLLFDRYLAQERVGRQDQHGKPVEPPWSIYVFLSPGILSRFKADYDEEAAA